MYLMYRSDRLAQGFSCHADLEAGISVKKAISSVRIPRISPDLKSKVQDLKVDDLVVASIIAASVLASSGSSGLSETSNYWNGYDANINQPVQEWVISSAPTTSTKTALKMSGGDQSKTGPGARAKADARRNQRSGSILIPGANGFTPQKAYHVYHQSGRLATPSPIIEGGIPDFNDGLPTRTVPSVSPNRQGRIKSQPLRIKSEHQKMEVVVTKKDIKKWMTPKDRKASSNQKLNEKTVEDKFVATVKNPDEVLDGTDIHHQQKTCKIYIQDVKTSDGTQEKVMLIADAETGRSYLGSILTEKEYANLKKTKEIDLFDLQRDLQTLVMNQKSLQESEVLSRAKDDGLLAKFDNIRRPYNVSESLADFVGTDSMGSKINIDIKGIDGSGRRPLDRQTQDINQNIKDLFDSADDPTKFQIICDISAAPTFLQKTIIKNITQGLDSSQLKNINFLF